MTLEETGLPHTKVNMHIPRKRFSQNFLKNKHIITRLVEVIAPQKSDRLIEIGPGLGALTTALLPKVQCLEAIELDRDLIAPLTESCKAYGNLILHSADALHFDFSTLAIEPHCLRIVGNLPYQISTPLLFHLVSFLPWIQDLHFMLQKEVVDRMAATTHTKAYGRLSVMIQYYFEVEPLFIVPPTAFYPEPKVVSQIVRLKPKTLKESAKNETLFSELVKQAFNYRRKTIQKSLRDWVSIEKLKELNINPQSRPEELSIETFIRLGNSL